MMFGLTSATIFYLYICFCGIPKVLVRSTNPPVYDENGNKLLMSFIIFHHGESSPAKPLVYPTFDFNFRLWPNGTDHLTGQGKRQMELLGKSIRRYYEPIPFPQPEPAIDINQLSKDLLERMISEKNSNPAISNSLKKRDISPETDKYHFRTLKISNYIQGAHHFARGFFQPPQSPFPTGPPPPPNFYVESLNYSYNDTYTTIAPQTVLPANDYLLYGGLACRRFNAILREIMTRSIEAEYVNSEFKRLFEEIALGSGIRDMSMMYLPVLADPLIILKDTKAKYMAALEARDAGIDESLKEKFDSLFPKWLKEDDFEKMAKIYQHLWYQIVYDDAEQIKLGIGQLLNRIIDLMLGGIGKVKTLIFEGGNEFKAIENPLPDMNFFVVPRHTLVALKKALRQHYRMTVKNGVPKQSDVKKRVDKIVAGKMAKVKYGETVIIELVQMDETVEPDPGKRYVVKFYEKSSYDPLDIIKPLKAGKCGTSCPLKSFYSQIKDILPTQIDKECSE